MLINKYVGGLAPAKRPFRVALSLSGLLVAAGCGGGGGEVLGFNYLSPFAPPSPVSIAVLGAFFPGAMVSTVTASAAALLATPKYMNSHATAAWLQSAHNITVTGQVYALKSSGAAFAHAAGLTGAGQIVAQSDVHLTLGHEVFAGNPTRIEVVNNTAGSEHGTAVASVILGNSANFVGTAPGARLVFGTFQSDQALADLGNRAADLGAVAWNNSWGYTSLYANMADFNTAFTGTASLNYLAALDRYAATGVVVFSVSNEETEIHSTLMDGLPYVRPSLEAGWIAVANGVPTFTAGIVSSVQLLSSSCLEAARWCLVADGSWNAATGSTNSYGFVTGSSFAAPQVSGALALLAQAFPTLDPHELRIRLLASAEDDFFIADATVELATGFFKGYSFTYGLGFLDIEAALKPIGGTTLALEKGGVVSTDTAVLQTGSALGDSVELALGGTDVLVKDALKAGFAMPAGALTTGALATPRSATLLIDSLRGDLAMQRVAAERPLSEPFAAYRGDTMTLSALDGSASASVLLPLGGNQAVGVNVTRTLADGPTRIDLGLKLARDGGGTFGLDGDNSAMQASVALGITQSLGGGGFVSISGEVGVTDLGGATALTRATTARFDSVGLKLGQQNIFTKGDRFTIGIGLPVAIASGRTTVTLPVIRSTGIDYENMSLNLAPENRQVDMQISYQTALADGVEMKLSLVRSDNFGNRAGASDSGAALAFTLRF